jgi:hypothetical protein
MEEMDQPLEKVGLYHDSDCNGDSPHDTSEFEHQATCGSKGQIAPEVEPPPEPMGKELEMALRMRKLEIKLL